MGDIAFAFEEKDVTHFARSLVRLRRRKGAVRWVTTKAGGPALLPEAKALIQIIVADGKWKPTQSIKQLTQLVDRESKWARPVSEDTIARALDQLFEETGDRLYQRLKRDRQAARRK